MFPFFKKKKQGEDSTVQAEQLFDGASEQQDEDVHTTLSIHPLMSLTTEQKYYFQYVNNELPPLKKIKYHYQELNGKKKGIVMLLQRLCETVWIDRFVLSKHHCC